MEAPALPGPFLLALAAVGAAPPGTRLIPARGSLPPGAWPLRRPGPDEHPARFVPTFYLRGTPASAKLGGRADSRTRPPLMHHDTSLIDIVAVGLALAFVLGAVANRLRLSPLVGYLIAGICVGPF